jgi:hypothetical protein
MQLSEAEARRKAWVAKGSPPCEHPRLVRLYYLGTQDTDRGCTTCGEEFSPQDVENIGGVWRPRRPG